MIRNEAALHLARELIELLAPNENSIVMPGLVATKILNAAKKDERAQALERNSMGKARSEKER